MAYSPFKMKGHTLPGIKQKQSPAKQKADTTKTYSLKDKTFPPEYTKKDIKFLEEQREDIVRRSDFPEGSKEQKMFDANQAKIKAKKAKKKGTGAIIDAEEIKRMGESKRRYIEKKKKSPAKQEGPINKQNPKLQKGEHPDTWVYKGKDKQERIIDLEDRAEFAREDGNKKLAKNLQHEADIIRNRKPNKKK